MADREQVTAELADKIVAGIVKADFTIDYTKFDDDDLWCALFGGSSYEALLARERLTERAIDLAAAWLESDPRGSALLDEEMEREAEFQADLASLNERERLPPPETPESLTRETEIEHV